MLLMLFFALPLIFYFALDKTFSFIQIALSFYSLLFTPPVIPIFLCFRSYEKSKIYIYAPIVFTVMAYDWRPLSQSTGVRHWDFGRYVLRNLSNILIFKVFLCGTFLNGYNFIKKQLKHIFYVTINLFKFMLNKNY